MAFSWALKLPTGINDAQGVLGLLNKFLLGTSGETTQRFAFFPNFTDSTGYRSEAEVNAAMDTAYAALGASMPLR